MAPSTHSVQTTQSTPSPTDASADASPFTQANLFGMLVAINLCLLAQPYGSLWYAKQKTTTGQILFFFWRLNPLAAIIEAVLILYTLGVATRDAVRSQDKWSQFCHGVGAILLLRSLSSRIRSVPITRERPTAQDSNDSEQGTDEREIPLVPPSEPGTALLSRPAVTDQLRLPQQTAAAAKASKPGVLSELLDTRSRGPWQLVIELVSLAAVVVTIVKLCVISIPWRVAVVPWLSVFSFLPCQLLVVLSHCIDQELIERPELFIHLNRLNKLLHKSKINLLAGFLLLPVIGWLRTDASISIPMVAYLWLLLLSSPILLTRAIKPKPLVILGFLGLWCVEWWQKKSRRNRHDVERVLAGSTRNSAQEDRFFNNVLASAWGLASILSTVFLGGAVLVVTKPAGEMFKSVLGLEFAGIAQDIIVFPTVFYLSLQSLLFPSSPLRGGIPQVFDLLVNIVLALLAIASIVVTHDARGTHKPDWLEWLG